ncbi:MAG: outer membrane lipoprotein-sorting protein [Desulfobulbaceae bacterium]|nr:outer membrane lipoprotein-sorting protein [Desulfobulbaceae bacterium]HIJ79650.1 outer membrane lipoprotein-sorting protein [Deltaproteobacteria bacterium]
MRLFMVIMLLFLLPPQAGAAITAAEIIKKVEDNLNGETARLAIAMTVKTSRTQRTVRLESFSIGTDKSFIRIAYPKKDEGITFLKVDKQMWQYVPRIEKIIKIPASMMQQSWMGSDFSNDDLIKESSISKDYDANLLGEDGSGFSLELIPHPEAPVVWGKIIMGVSRSSFLPTEVDYFDEEGVLVRTLYYREVQRFAGRLYPSLWVMEPKTPDKAGHQTIVRVEAAEFDQPIDPEYFTKRALKRFSK